LLEVGEGLQQQLAQVVAASTASRGTISLKVLRIKWMMQVCTVASGHTLPTTSGRPFNPSQTKKNTSLTPRLRISVSTLIQNFAPSPPLPAHRPRMSFSPVTVTPIAA
jgi:hypothetical protein